ncbi:MAG: 23S rRNA (adenine(2030)-N(6))-methyltransferase RlmJ [Pseudomonadota bacterium]
MLSYQHGFHAGNRADVLKHACLHAILSSRSGGRPVFYVETHAGRGVYDLQNAQAAKTGEARDGVLDLLNSTAPKPLQPWLDAVRPPTPKAYPGSPKLASDLLGDRDRIVLFELHPTENVALTDTVGTDDRIQIKKADGYAGALKLSPRRGEDMILFVDPSYETLRDMDALAAWTPRALKRWPRAMLVLWLPLYRDERETELGAYLSDLEDGVIAGARWPTDPLDETALEGSAIVAYRAPDAAASKCVAIANALQAHWSDR